MKKSLALLLVLMLMMSLFVGCSPAPAPTTPATEAPAAATEAPATETVASDFTVGFIYVGPVGDGGWTFAHDKGRLALEKELGVKTLFKESVPETQECEKAIRDMIDGGAKVIFATSFGYMDYVEKVAKDYPDVAFLHCSGYKSGTNFSNYFGRIYEARYLSGLVAGMKTKSNKVGYVAAFSIPEVVRGINAFTLGVQAVNPEATVDVVWTHTWYDPAKEKEAALSLLDLGCDVIAQHQDTAGPQQAAEERGAFAVGYNTPSLEKAPNAYMTAPIWNWAPYYVEQVKLVMDKKWTPTNYWGHMNDGIVKLDTLSKNAPEGAQAKIDEYTAKIIDGSFHPFAGPIKDQTGTVIVPEGKTMTDDEMLNFMWFVQGVNGTIEK